MAFVHIVRSMAVALGALVLGACSSSISVPGDAGTTNPSSSGGDNGGGTDGGGNAVTSTHASLPLIDDNGGGIITAPEIITVTFDPGLYANATSPDAATMITDLQAFDDGLTQSQWWDTVRAGYCSPANSTNCVGKGGLVPTTIGHVSIKTPPAASYTDEVAPGGSATLRTYIAGLFAAKTLPPPTENSIYVFYFPSTTTLTLDQGATNCVQGGFGGYHHSVTVGSLDVPYVVVPVCDPEQTQQAVPLLTVEQTATHSASHEIIEAATDPHAAKPAPATNPNANVGFYMTATANQAWPLVLGGGEAGDLCVDQFGFGQDRITSGKYTVQRIWNNESARAGHDPCVPIPAGQVYFNVAPPAGDEELQMAVGDNVAFKAIAFADGTLADWQVQVLDVGQSAAGQPTVLTTSPAKATAINGVGVDCSITLASAPQRLPGEAAGQPGVEPFVILSVSSTKQYHLWPGIVVGK